MKNGVSSDIYEGKIQAKKCEREGERGKEKKGKGGGERKKRMRDSPNPGGSALFHF